MRKMQPKTSLGNFWKNKRVMITGFSGFKGAWMTLLLSRLGSKVYGYSLNNLLDKKNNKILKLESHCKEVCYGDILNKKRLEKFYQKTNPHIVIHMAAQSIVEQSYINPKRTFEVNIIGLINLLNCIKKKVKQNKPIIFVLTSDKCYENNKSKKFIESDNLNGDDPYSGSKAAQEVVCNSYNKSFNLNIATARAGNVLGGCDFNKGRIMVDLMESIFRKKKLFIRNKFATRPWQHVIDLNINYLKFIKKFYYNPKLAQPWNFGPKKSFSVNKIINLLKKDHLLSYNKSKNIFREKKFLNISSNKIKKELKITNNFAFSKTIKETVEWYEVYYKSKKKIYEFSLKQVDKALHESKLYK